jgi:hypothetical protein
MTREGFCPQIHFDAGDDASRDEHAEKGRALNGLLTNRFIIEDRAADAVTELRRGHEQLAIRPP